MRQFELQTARGTLRWRGTAVMGIVNTTPDSFSDGGSHAGPESAVRHALALMNQGALLIDVGGESTRPGAVPVSADEELRRVLPVLEDLSAMGIPLSIDTLKPEVARAALAAGAWLVNDVSGLRDPEMIPVIAAAGAGAVIMHMQGDPATMQDAPRYGDVVAEVRAALLERARAAGGAGIKALLLDPGIGFGKNLEHNLELLRRLPELLVEEWPLLIGASRKGMLGALTGERDPAERDAASAALHLHAARAGAAMVRVHDVAGHVQALKVQQAILGDEI